MIAGGGFAALEAALALRALAGQRAQLTLISPDPTIRYRAAATVEAFDETAPLAYDLGGIAADLDARYEQSSLTAVESQARRVRLGTGAELGYDALILAIGAQRVESIPGALTFRDQRDVPRLRGLLSELDAGQIARLALVVPSGSAWPLPLYELALLCAARVERRRLQVEISLITPEAAPLEIFGTEASRLVTSALAKRGVRFVGGSAVASVGSDGTIALQFDGTLQADRVITAPALRARRITGVPASWWGFVPTDALGRVEGLRDVYAAGDMTTFPIKQGGLAAQQAERIAHTIAASLGARVGEPPLTRVLRARLLGGPRPLLLRAELDREGHPTGATIEQGEIVDPAGSSKVLGRYLTPYLASLEASGVTGSEGAAASA